MGKYNIRDASDKYAFIIGNGTQDTSRSNAFAIDWNGLIYQNNSTTGVDLNNKVDKVDGKGLSTNDYTTAEKNKLASLENYDDSDLRKWVNEETGYGKITILKTGTNKTTYNSTNKDLLFYFRMDVDAFQELKQVGLIATTNAAIKYQLTLDTAPETGVTYVKITETSAGIYGLNYSWTKTNVNPGDTWYVVPFMKYDSGDDSYLKYGPLYSVTANSDSTVSITTISPSPFNVIYDVLNNKVDKVDGKSLSTNDFTNADKTEIAKLVDAGAKNLLNLNTALTSLKHRGITYKNNNDGTINVSGTSNANDSYVTIYDLNTDNLFGVSKGKTVVITSTSDDVSISIVPKIEGGAYGTKVNAYKSSPAVYTIPSDFSGFLLRVSVLNNGTTVNEDVNGMICTIEDYTISPEFVPYTPTMREIYENKSDISTVGLRLVASNILHSNASYTYSMNKDDFDKNEIGTYIISIMTWSTTPKYGLYAVSYTGNSLTYTSVVKIAGDDMTITVENGVISVSGLPSYGGKISIHALQ